MTKDYVFFGIRCQVFPAGTGWRFRIWKPNGTLIEFVGVPNYCDTARSAMMRAWHRCRWLADGTYYERYK